MKETEAIRIVLDQMEGVLENQREWLPSKIKDLEAELSFDLAENGWSRRTIAIAREQLESDESDQRLVHGEAFIVDEFEDATHFLDLVEATFILCEIITVSARILSPKPAVAKVLDFPGPKVANARLIAASQTLLDSAFASIEAINEGEAEIALLYLRHAIDQAVEGKN